MMLSTPRILLLAGVIASAWAGYSFGHKAEGDQESVRRTGKSPRLLTGAGQRADQPRRSPEEIRRLFDAGELTMHEAWEALERCGAEELRAALSPSLEDPSKGRPAGRVGLGEGNEMLLFRWAQLDPQGAMTYAKSFPESDMIRNYMANVFVAWWTRDPKAACDWAASDPVTLREHVSWAVSVLEDGDIELSLRRAHELGADVFNAKVEELVMYGDKKEDLLAQGRSIGIPLEKALARAANLAAIEPAWDIAAHPSEVAADDPFAGLSEPSRGLVTWSAALQKLASLKLEGDDEASLRDEMALLWSTVCPADVIKWSAARDGITGSPLQRHCMNEWFMEKDSDSALAWLGAQADAASLYPGLVSTLRRLIAARQEGGDRGSFFSPTEESRRKLDAVSAMWRRIDPEGEERWRSASRAQDLDASSGIVMDAFRFGQDYE